MLEKVILLIPMMISHAKTECVTLVDLGVLAVQ